MGAFWTFWAILVKIVEVPFKLLKIERKLKQSLELSILTHELYVLKIYISAHVGKSFAKCLLSELTF